MPLKNTIGLRTRGGSGILVWEGHWQEVWGRNYPSGVQGQSPGGGLGAKLREARGMLRHEAQADKNHLRRKKKQVHTD